MLRTNCCCAVLLALAAILSTHAQGAPAQGKIGNGVSAKLANSPTATVVVALKPAARMQGENAAQRKMRIAGDAESLLAALPNGSFKVRHRYANVEALALEVTAAAIPALSQRDDVLRVDLDVGGGAQMLEAAQAAHIDTVRAAGYTGKGVKVAIIDSGAQVDHPDLADSIADEYCFCSNGTPGVGCCPDGSDVQGGAGSAVDAYGHGTNVTGIVTGDGNFAPQGGAPDASVVLLRVLDAQGRFNDTSDIAAALDWVASNHADTKVVNLSLGTDALFADTCDNSTAWTMALKQAVDAVLANGAIVTVSSGNNASASSISAPACISGVIAVGALWDAPMQDQTFMGCTDTGIVPNKPTCFTNSNALVSIYAPGAYTTATGSNVDPYTVNYASTYGGTSQAAPLVAACIADLYQAHPELTASDITHRLLSTSAHVTDPKNGLAFPLLDCQQSLGTTDVLFDASFETGD
jgi:subtilisin family serine protease